MATAGTRGPIPKRSDQRRRTNDTGDVTKAAAGKQARRPPVNGHWHPIAKRWYLALADSGQVVFFEPSDWAHAYFVAEAMSRLLTAKKFSAQLFAALDSSTTRLMVTEGDRRRLRVELEREKAGAEGSDPDHDAAVTSMHEWQAKVGAAG